MLKFKNLFLLFTLMLFTGLTFNAYAGPVTLPNYIGQTEGYAIADLNATDGLNYDAAGSTKVNDNAPVGDVIGQNPTAGPVDFDTDVTLVVSLGPATTTSTTTTTVPATTTTTPVVTTTTPGVTTTTPVVTTTTPVVTTTTPGVTTTTPVVTTTLGGIVTTTTAAVTTTTAVSTTTTAAASTTTTTLPPQGSESVKDEPLAGSEETVTIKTEPGQTITAVSTEKATNAPSGYDFPFGTISYTTSSPVGGDVTMRFKFSADLPGKLTVFKVDKNGNYTELPTNLWKKIDDRTIDVTVTDGDALTDMDGAADGSTEDPIAVAGQQSSGGGGGGGDDDQFDFGGGGCSIGNTQSAGMDPIWLFLLLAPGLGILRRRAAARGTAGTKSA